VPSYQRWPESLFQTPLLFRLNLSLDPSAAIFQIWEFHSCSDSGCNHRSDHNLPMFLLKKWPHRLLLLPKSKSDSRSGAESERKTQNLARADSRSSATSASYSVDFFTWILNVILASKYSCLVQLFNGTVSLFGLIIYLNKILQIYYLPLCLLHQAWGKNNVPGMKRGLESGA